MVPEWVFIAAAIAAAAVLGAGGACSVYEDARR